MFTPPARVRLLAAGSVLTLAAVAGCSSDEVLETDDLEAEVMSFLEREAGLTEEQISEVDCPDELDREEDASVRCTVTGMDGTALGATVTVTDADAGDVFIQMDDEFLDGSPAQDPATEDQATAEDPAASDPQAGTDAGTSGGVQTIAAGDVEQQIADAVQRQTGTPAQSVSCPSDINAVVGGSMTCTTTEATGVQHDTLVEITSVDASGGPTFDIEIEPTS